MVNLLGTQASRLQTFEKVQLFSEALTLKMLQLLQAGRLRSQVKTPRVLAAEAVSEDFSFPAPLSTPPAPRGERRGRLSR